MAGRGAATLSVVSTFDSAPPVRRPAVVSVAAYLMILVAVIAVVLAILPLPYVSAVSDAAKRAYASTPNPDTVATFTTIGTYVGAVIRILGAVGFVILAVFNLKGSNVSRIITWVFAGLGVLCCGGGAFAGQAASGMRTSNVQGVDTKEAARQIAAAYPSWFSPLNNVFLVLVVVALILVIVLLTLSAANAFFKGGGGGGGRIEDPPLPYPPVA
jgi:hypothetical protein